MKPRKVIMILRQDPFLEGAVADDFIVAAVDDPILPDHDEDYVLATIAQNLGHSHEYVESTKRLHAARDVGDDSDTLGHGPIADAAREIRLRPPELRVHAVKDDAHLVVVKLGKSISLPLCRAIAQIACIQVQEQGRVANA